MLGWFLATLPDRRHAVVLTAALLALHAMGALAGSFRNVHPATAAGEGRELAMQRETVQALERAGLRRVYDSNIGNRALTFLAAEQVIVSHPYEEIRPRYARAVDGAPEVVWWMPRRSPGLEAHFAALGVGFTFRPMSALGGAYGGFTLSAPPVREIAPTTLRVSVHAPSPAPGATLPAAGLAVTASRHTQRGGLAVDGDPATRWATAAPRAAGDWFRVDLRAARVIRGMRLAVANPADLPPELAVEGSLDGVGWRRLAATLRTERRYRWGGFGLLNDGGATAVRLDFPPATLAALRVVLPAGDPVFDWSIHELTVYGGE